MNWNQATLHAATGDILILPGWEGCFKFDWEKKEMYFLNGDYRLNAELLKEFRLHERNDWYYIV